MRNSRSDVVAAGLRVLDELGLESLSMRRIAAALDVQPSALYHHVPDKQTLLALMADEIVRDVGGGGSVDESSAVELTGGGTEAAGSGLEVVCDAVETTRGASPSSANVARAGELCRDLRRAMLAVRDGADVVATASAYRLGASGVEAALSGLVGEVAARTLLLFVFGDAQSVQTHEQALAVGAIPQSPPVDHEAMFAEGLDLILAGLR